MTDTITTTAPTANGAVATETGSIVEATPTTAALSPKPSSPTGETVARECVDVDPTSLIIGDNVRAAAHLDRQFLASLREHGVMNPIQATRANDGTLTVQRGQRRTLGAVKAGLTSVPVLVVADDTDEADRIVKQWHENERRDALTETDRLAAVEQLTILGVPAGNIARRLGTPKKQVEAAVAANGSDLAKAAARKHALTLTDAALIAEDDEDTVKDILRAVKDGGSAEHVAQRARDDKARQQAHDQAVAALVQAGVTVTDRPGYDDKSIKELREIRLLNKDGSAKKKAPTEAEHAACPGHAAYVTTYYTGTPNVTYVCTNPKANGHALSSWNGETRLPGQQPGGGMSEEQKAERKTLIANNKAWDSAETVRRAWLAEAFLTRTIAPKGAETFLATAVAYDEHTEDSHRLYLTLTGALEQGQQAWMHTHVVRDRIANATPRSVLMLALALIVCEWESTTSRDTWRRPSDRDRRYLTGLIGWGYQPSDVERLILAQAKVEDDTEPVDDDIAEPTDPDDTDTGGDDAEATPTYTDADADATIRGN